jgi:hypothetical protein
LESANAAIESAMAARVWPMPRRWREVGWTMEVMRRVRGERLIERRFCWGRPVR